MKYRRIGKTSLKVSEISFGCMSLDVTSKDSESLLRSAVDHGINFFDTADLYDKGENERVVGKALQSVRNQVIIATKVGNQWREDGSGWDWNPTKTYILKAVEDSLRRLNTDYIDLYQLHGGTIEDPIDETIEAFELLKEQGKIRAYGISSIRPNVIREWVSKSNMSSVMMQYSLLDRRPEEAMLELLGTHDISVITRGTLAKGLLVDKPAKSYLNYTESQVAELQAKLQDTGNELSLAIQYVLANQTVSSAVLGMRTLNQLESILMVVELETDPRYIKEIKQILPINTYNQHR
ncbi:MAG: aldo/keto reductase [Balneolaceae bacterium]|nr:aldo/keto reductase [Balneolaceae bacterium]